jgi:hypothetical protein
MSTTWVCLHKLRGSCNLNQNKQQFVCLQLLKRQNIDKMIEDDEEAFTQVTQEFDIRSLSRADR